MTELLIGTDEGLRTVHGAASPHAGRIDALLWLGGASWAVSAGVLLRGGDDGWTEIARLPGGEGTCLGAAGGSVLVGTAEAHLHRLAGGSLEQVASFEAAEGREKWYTPWGGPPDTRSISTAPDGRVYVNVHVGGILRSESVLAAWTPTIDIDSDVHEVLAHPAESGVVLAATAVGLAVSRDAGTSWTFHDDGLHGSYCRAVRLAGDVVILTASEGHRGDQAAVYRGTLDELRFERAVDGLPEWFGANIDTGCLTVVDDVVAFGTVEGDVFVSRDRARTWERVVAGLPAVRCLMAT